MATIVSNQNYNPWREQFGVNLLTQLLTGALERGRAADQNRKEAAWLGRVGELGQSQVDTSMTSPLLQRQQFAPDPGTDPSMIPWISSSRSAGPMTPLDALTAQPPAVTTPNVGLSDIIRELDTPRFSMLGARGLELANPILKANEAERLKAQRQAFLEGLDFGGNPQTLMSKILQGNVLGLIDSAAMGHTVDFQKHYNPQPQLETLDLGDRKEIYEFTPTPGQPLSINTLRSAPVGMSPYQEESVKNDRARVAQGWAQVGLQRDRLNQERKQYGTPFEGPDGGMYTYNQYTGEAMRMNIPAASYRKMDDFTKIRYQGLVRLKIALSGKDFLEGSDRELLNEVDREMQEIESAQVLGALNGDTVPEGTAAPSPTALTPQLPGQPQRQFAPPQFADLDYEAEGGISPPPYQVWPGNGQAQSPIDEAFFNMTDQSPALQTYMQMLGNPAAGAQALGGNKSLAPGQEYVYDPTAQSFVGSGGGTPPEAPLPSAPLKPIPVNMQPGIMPTPLTQEQIEMLSRQYTPEQIQQMQLENAMYWEQAKRNRRNPPPRIFPYEN
jgi:hypothetical protein